jgi:hypothetical protein
MRVIGQPATQYRGPVQNRCSAAMQARQSRLAMQHLSFARIASPVGRPYFENRDALIGIILLQIGNLTSLLDSAERLLGHFFCAAARRSRSADRHRSQIRRSLTKTSLPLP